MITVAVMKSRNILFVFLAAILLIPFLASAASVERAIQDKEVYPGQAVIISLVIDVDSEKDFYAIDEVIPEGFQAIDAAGGSAQQPGHIKWAEFQSAKNITIKYILKVLNKPGVYSFNGEYASIGMEIENKIAGDNTVVIKSPQYVWPIIIGAVAIVAILIALLFKHGVKK